MESIENSSFLEAETSVVPVEPSIPAQEPVPVPVTEAQVQVLAPSVRSYPSLYDTRQTTVAAVILGILIVAGVQYAVQRIYTKARNEHEILTRFVVTIVALVVGAYITDLLIAGPDTSLLSDDEHTIILSFIKDICLMVFAFYFGTKSAPQPKDNP